MDAIKLILCNLLITVLIAMILACSGGSPSPEPPEQIVYTYQAPLAKNDQIAVAPISEMNLDLVPLENMMARVLNDGFINIDSILIYKDGKLFFEENMRTSLDGADIELGNTDLELHSMMSVSKSVLSAVVGIAIDSGAIASVEDKVHDYFQDYLPVENWDERKESISLKNYLTMRHGYEMTDQNFYPILHTKNDFVDTILDVEMYADPGTDFRYATAVSHAIGAIVQEASGENAIDYFQTQLFDPLGIKKVHWSTSPVGRPETGRGLFLTDRAMLKFGVLFLNQGVWNGAQLISQSWVEASTAEHVSFNAGSRQSGYGYQWWTDDFNLNGTSISAYHAEGNGGQFIWVINELNAVVVFTGSNYNSELMVQPYDLMQQYILPVLISAQ